MASTKSFLDHGNAILQRLAGEKIPSIVKAPLAAFKKEHTGYVAAAKAVADAEGARNDRLSAVGANDELLDAAVEALAEKLVGAGLGKRTQPLASFTKHPVHKLVSLAYRTEAQEVTALCTKVLAKKPPKDVVNAANVCLKHAKSVESSLAALVQPQAKYQKALSARDALLPTWSKSLSTLKKHAAAAWSDDQATYKSVFADPSAVQAPKAKPRKKKAAPTNNAPATSAPPTP